MTSSTPTKLKEKNEDSFEIFNPLDLVNKVIYDPATKLMHQQFTSYSAPYVQKITKMKELKYVFCIDDLSELENRLRYLITEQQA